MNPDDLTPLKDDMIAFIEGHGMRHFPALIPEETPRVWWDDPETEIAGTPQGKESWKDFVEMAKAAGSPMVCVGEDILDKPTLDLLATEFQELAGTESFSPETEKLDRLFLQVGKLGHIELAFAHQGILFVHESATEWYRQYRQMVDMVDNLQDLIGDVYNDGDEEQA